MRSSGNNKAIPIRSREYKERGMYDVLHVIYFFTKKNSIRLSFIRYSDKRFDYRKENIGGTYACKLRKYS